MDEDYPRTLLEFEDRFRTEEACGAYLVRLRWPQGFRCPRCAHGQAWRLRRGLFQCRGCDAMVSVTAGTIFHRSHLSLRVWFRAIWWLTNQKSGVSAVGLQRTLGLGSYKTAWTCLHKLRRAMVRPGREPLTGEVEVDEVFIGGVEKGGGKRHVGTKALVAIATEVRGPGIGRIRMRQENRGTKTGGQALISERKMLARRDNLGRFYSCEMPTLKVETSPVCRLAFDYATIFP